MTLPWIVASGPLMSVIALIGSITTLLSEATDHQGVATRTSATTRPTSSPAAASPT
jgi:hypothetical protein